MDDNDSDKKSPMELLKEKLPEDIWVEVAPGIFIYNMSEEDQTPERALALIKELMC